MVSCHSRVRVLVVLVMAVPAGWLVDGARRMSPTDDETAHLPAGVSYWQFGRFDLYPVNPPLVKLVAAANSSAVRFP